MKKRVINTDHSHSMEIEKTREEKRRQVKRREEKKYSYNESERIWIDYRMCTKNKKENPWNFDRVSAALSLLIEQQFCSYHLLKCAKCVCAAMCNVHSLRNPNGSKCLRLCHSKLAAYVPIYDVELWICGCVSLSLCVSVFINPYFVLMRFLYIFRCGWKNHTLCSLPFSVLIYEYTYFIWNKPMKTCYICAWL